MFEFLFDVVIIMIGFALMVTGLIEYLFIGFLFYLLILVVLNIFAHIWLCFRSINDK